MRIRQSLTPWPPGAGGRGVGGEGFGRWVGVLCAGFLLAAALPAADLVPIPAPSLVGMEDAVREQLREGLAEVETLAAEPDVEPAELAEAYGTLAGIYLAYDLGGPAEACLVNARALAPEDFRWPYLLGALYQNQRRLEEAAASLDAALALRPRDLPALVRLGNVHLAGDRPEPARLAFERALDVDAGSAAALAGLARVAAAQREFETAARRFEAALAIQPEASALRYPLAIAYRELGRVEEARRQLAQRGENDVRFADPLLQQTAGLAVGSGIQLLFGNRALRRGDLATAIARYRQAVAVNPRSAEAHQALGAALAESGDAGGAIEHYSASLAARPENPRLHYNLGTLLVERGQREQAIRHFEAALELAPGYANARFNLANVLAQAGRPEAAWSHYEKLLRDEPGDPATRFYAAQTLHELGRDQQAAELLGGLVAEDPGRARARLALGVVLAARGETGAAAEQFASVLALGSAEPPERAAAHRQLALLDGREGRFDAAAGHYRALVEDRPRDAEARFGEAMALLLAGRHDAVRRRLEEGLAALPESAELAHLLARFLATCPDAGERDGERALGLALGLFRSAPRPEAAETVAMAYAELGRFEEAVDWQQRLIREAERAGAAALLPRLRERLALYRRGQPCRAPWLDGAPSAPP